MSSKTHLPGADPKIASEVVLAIVQHVCNEHEELFADVVEWCESRKDCATVVVCPECDRRFVLDEDDLSELRRWSDAMGEALACGVRWE